MIEGRYNEDGFVIDHARVEWPDNSAAAYCRNPDCDWQHDDAIHGERAKIAEAKLHTATTGHPTKVETQEAWIVDIQKEKS